MNKLKNILIISLFCMTLANIPTILGQNFNKNQQLNYSNCPPYLELTDLTDGEYFANMTACGLEGSVIFNLTTMEIIPDE